MAVYKRTYKAYRGAMTPAWSRFTVLSRYGFSTLFASRPFTAFAVLCFLPFLGGLTIIYVVHSGTVQALLNMRIGNAIQVNNVWFLRFLGFEAWMAFLLTAWAGPGMLSKDFANHSIQLYLSRPLSRAEYLVGKISVLAALLSCTTWIPALVLFGLNAELQGHGWGADNLWLAGSIIVSGLLWIALISLISLAVSVWVKWRIAATALMIGIFFLLPGFGGAIDLVMRTHWGMLLNLFYIDSAISAHLFRYTPHQLHAHGAFDVVPLWTLWASALTFCATSLWLLHRRLKAREVERS
jgi:ABC-2 type transport system permease protein